jgi:hypothetical protein
VDRQLTSFNPGTELRAVRGGPFNDADWYNASYVWFGFPGTSDNHNIGFRLVLTLEPGTGALVAAGLLGLVSARRRRGAAK